MARFDEMTDFKISDYLKLHYTNVAMPVRYLSGNDNSRKPLKGSATPRYPVPSFLVRSGIGPASATSH